MIAMEELELNNADMGFAALTTALRGFGAIVESLDTFWTERIQLPVQWDPVQGIVTEGSGDHSSKDLSDSLDASTSSEETVMKHFDPRTTALPVELIPLCNLYDRHILRQKVVIQLSLPANERGKLRSSGGDVVLERADQIHLWHVQHLLKSGDNKRTQSDFPEAIDLSVEDMILVSDDEDAEGVPRADDDEQMTLLMDLNQGLPDYRTMWIAGAQVKDRGQVRCSSAQLCGQSHMCLRCRADVTRKKNEQWEVTDSRVAAHLLLHKRSRKWKTLRTSSIWEYLMDLDENLKKRPQLQKALSHF
jgi:hypothetical protein